MIEDVLAQLQGVRKCASCWSARCPVHGDGRNSLILKVGETGNVLVKCYANRGCTFAEIRKALGLPSAAWFAVPMKERGRMEIVKTYNYTDEHGNLMYQTVRLEPKDFRQRQPDGKGWKWTLEGVRKVLYNLPAIIKSKAADRIVYIVEGEKDADSLIKAGAIATTNCCGAGKWLADYNPPLLGRRVVVIPDNDDAGIKHAEQVIGSLIVWGVKAIAMLRLPDCKDVSEFLAKEGSLDFFKKMVWGLGFYSKVGLNHQRSNGSVPA